MAYPQSQLNKNLTNVWLTNEPQKEQKMKSIVDVLVKRDGLSKREAENCVADFQDRLYSGEIDPFEADDEFMDEFGLEPDYLLDLLY